MIKYINGNCIICPHMANGIIRVYNNKSYHCSIIITQTTNFFLFSRFLHNVAHLQDIERIRMVCYKTVTTVKHILPFSKKFIHY